MKRHFYCWVVLAGAALTVAGCSQSNADSWFDIGSANDMMNRQQESRSNQPIPKATEMPPGLGEDLPMQDQTAQPLTSGQ